MQRKTGRIWNHASLFQFFYSPYSYYVAAMTVNGSLYVSLSTLMICPVKICHADKVYGTLSPNQWTHQVKISEEEAQQWCTGLRKFL